MLIHFGFEGHAFINGVRTIFVFAYMEECVCVLESVYA